MPIRYGQGDKAALQPYRVDLHRSIRHAIGDELPGNLISNRYQLFEMFPDQESARVYLEGRLWPDGVRCPVCGMGERITSNRS